MTAIIIPISERWGGVYPIDNPSCSLVSGSKNLINTLTGWEKAENKTAKDFRYCPASWDLSPLPVYPNKWILDSPCTACLGFHLPFTITHLRSEERRVGK